MVGTRLAALLALVTPACATAQLWTPQPLADDAEASGRVWMEQGVAAQGGELLPDHPVASVWLRDEWPNWLYRVLGMPWPENDVLFRQDFLVGTDDSRLTFLEGEETGSGWGVQQGVTYRFGEDGTEWDPPDEKPDGRIQFWLPTNGYFLFMAWRIREATFVRDLGEVELEGRRYRKVFATWGRPDPPSEVDQYLLFYEVESHLLRWVKYTVRDLMGSAEAVMHMEDYQAAGHYLFPRTLRVVDDLGRFETGVHRYQVEDLQLSPGLAPEGLRPRPQLRREARPLPGR